jgi:hypothetical protein
MAGPAKILKFLSERKDIPAQATLLADGLPAPKVMALRSVPAQQPNGLSEHPSDP